MQNIAVCKLRGMQVSILNICALVCVPVHVCVLKVPVHTVCGYMCTSLCTHVCVCVCRSQGREARQQQNEELSWDVKHGETPGTET